MARKRRMSRRQRGPSLAHRVRATLNVLNLTTPIGLAVALAGRARLRRGPDGLWIGEGYRCRYPVAGAFTVGNVVTTSRSIAELERVLPDILAHESAHATQYSALGVLFFPLYTLSAGWSWLRASDPAVRNAFERRAGLAEGGYPPRGAKTPLRARPAPRRGRAPWARRTGRP